MTLKATNRKNTIGMSKTDTTPDRITGKVRNSWGRGLLIAAGSLSVALGVIGIFVPLLPTTPLRLLAAWCYARSSDRFHNWLMNHRWLGPYIRHYRDGLGTPLREKIITLAVPWLTIGATYLFLISNIYWEIVLGLVAVGVTIHILHIPTRH